VICVVFVCTFPSRKVLLRDRIQPPASLAFVFVHSLIASMCLSVSPFVAVDLPHIPTHTHAHRSSRFWNATGWTPSQLPWGSKPTGNQILGSRDIGDGDPLDFAWLPMDFTEPKLVVGGLFDGFCDADLPTISGNIRSYGDGVVSKAGMSLSEITHAGLISRHTSINHETQEKHGPSGNDKGLGLAAGKPRPAGERSQR
jgi:hypothetical protein